MHQERPHAADPRGRVEHLASHRGSAAAANARGQRSAPTVTARSVRRPRVRRSSRRPRRSRRRSRAVLNGVSGIAASEAAYSVASVCNRLALFGNGMLAGTVETMLERTRYAAVAAAASFEAFASKRVLRRYGLMPRLDRVDRVVDGALDHPHVDLEGRRCSARRPRERDERARRDPVPVRDLVGLPPPPGAAGATTAASATTAVSTASQTTRLRAMVPPLGGSPSLPCGYLEPSRLRWRLRCPPCGRTSDSGRPGAPPHTKVPNGDTRMPRLSDSPSLWTCHPPPGPPSAASSPEALLLCLAPDQDQSSKGSEAINQCTGRKKRLTARLPIFRPWSIPSSTAFRKWNPTRMRETPFSSLAWEKLV